MTSDPGEHPEPSNLVGCSPYFVTLEPGTTFSRIHDRDYSTLFFGRTGRNRFDSPDKSFGVLYVGLDEFCAFIETFGQTTGIRLISQVELGKRHLSYLKLTKALTVIDLCESGGLTRLGADGRLFTGSPAVAQRWSKAIHDLPAQPTGILYRARHDPARQVCALFDVPDSTFEVKTIGSLVDDGNKALLSRILELYDFGLV